MLFPEVPFESITEADERPEVYPRPPAEPLPAKLNHVYVVKTIEGHYVKFIVRKIIPEPPANEPERSWQREHVLQTGD